MTEPLTLAQLCATCGVTLVRRPGSHNPGAPKRWCNEACRRAGAALPERRCAGCGALLVRFPTEAPSKFASRRSCLALECKRVSVAQGAEKARAAKAAPKKPTPKITVELGATWQVYHTGGALPKRDPMAAEIRRLVKAGAAVTTIRRGQDGQLEYVCKARAA